MNKNSGLAIVLVIILGLGLWWFVDHTKPSDSLTPTATISVSVSPTASAKASPTSTPVQPNITITSPKSNATVSSPIVVTGKARVFENQFTVQMKDSSGKVVFQKEGVMTDAKEAGVFGNYSVSIPAPVNDGVNFTITAFSLSAKGDGSYEGYASVAVKLNAVVAPLP